MVLVTGEVIRFGLGIEHTSSYAYKLVRTIYLQIPTHRYKNVFALKYYSYK